jgi:transposase
MEGVRKGTKPRTVDLYEIFNGVLYLLKSACQWRMLPEGFPKWSTVYSYFAKWSKPGPDDVSVLEQALKKQVGEARAEQGRDAMTSFLIVDAQSVKNTDSAEQKGYDAGKKVSGIKRHIGVDTQGLPTPLPLPPPKLPIAAGLCRQSTAASRIWSE